MSFHYSPRIVTDGLVLYLDAANPKSYSSGSNTWYDLSGNNNHFVISGTDYFLNPSHHSFNNNEIDQIYNSSCNLFNGLSNITVSIWVRFDSISVDAGLVSYAINGSDNEYLMFYGGSNSPKRFHMGFDGIVTYVNYDLLPNTWYNIVNTIGSITKLYVNCTLINNTAKVGTVLSGSGYCVFGQEQDAVGGGFQNTQDLNGDISLVKIYNRELSSSEVVQNYNATKGRFGL